MISVKKGYDNFFIIKSFHLYILVFLVSTRPSYYLVALFFLKQLILFCELYAYETKLYKNARIVFVRRIKPSPPP
jgi:hypothetical protein